MNPFDDILERLAELVVSQKFVDMETDGIEIKPVPSQGNEWKAIHQSVNAFLNTRGGVVILGIREEQNPRRYVVTGWKEHAENNLRELADKFTNLAGNPLKLATSFPLKQIREMPGNLGRVCIVYVDRLPADQQYVFLDGQAYKRHLTGDLKLTAVEIQAQEEFKEQAKNARELQPVPGLVLADLDLDKLNAFIIQLNQPVQIETIKPNLEQAKAFLARRCFTKVDAVTILGALVCATYPNESLGFQCHVHAYVDLRPKTTDPNAGEPVVHDKQDFVDNVLQLMESSYGYLLRNIQVGISLRAAGSSEPQYPAALLRETVNNALAHRNYANDRQVIVTVAPGRHIAIQNPGSFNSQLLLEAPNDEIPVFRIIPEAKPRNPKLADVLRVFRKWEGRGIGMATLVNMCLQNVTDVPYYRLLTEEVRLHVCAGHLLDERMERHFSAFDGHIAEKLGGDLTKEQKLVMSYLIKSEWLNRRLMHTILLTPDNNHFEALAALEKVGLIKKHPQGTAHNPVYIADRVLVSLEHVLELRTLFGATFEGLKPFPKQVLGIVFRFNKYSKIRAVSAKAASYALWYEEGERGGVEQFDSHYRRVRLAFNRLLKLGYVKRETSDKSNGYLLNESYSSQHLTDES